MIVGVGTDFEITFTNDLFKISWQNNDFVSKFQYLKKKLAMVLSKIQVSDPVPFWRSCLGFLRMQQNLIMPVASKVLNC